MSLKRSLQRANHFVTGVYFWIFHGAGEDILKPQRQDGLIRYCLDWLDYFILKWFDWIDTKCLFDNRAIRTRTGRVRSYAERRLVKFFDRHQIKFVYEKELVLEGITLHPDFYLPAYGVYVEFWGMVGFSKKYEKIMVLKKELYRRHGIPVISVYPRHFSKLERVFLNIFRQVTGKELTLVPNLKSGDEVEADPVVGSVVGRKTSVLPKGVSRMRTLGILALVAIVIVGGIWLVGGQVKYWAQGVKTSITDSSSDGTLIAATEEGMDSARSELKKRWIDIYQVRTEIAKVEGETKAQQGKITREEQILKRAKDLLTGKNPGDKISIGRVEYTYEQVNDDILRRVGSCEVLRRSVGVNEQSLAKLRKAYNDGQEMIRRKNEELRQKQIEFQAEIAELSALRAQQHVNEVIGKVYSGGDIQTELGEYRRAFDKRLTAMRAGAEFDEQIGGTKTGAVGTWDKELGIPELKAVDAVNRYFDTKAEPAAQLSPIEALEKVPETPAAAPAK